MWTWPLRTGKRRWVRHCCDTELDAAAERLLICYHLIIILLTFKNGLQDAGRTSMRLRECCSDLLGSKESICLLTPGSLFLPVFSVTVRPRRTPRAPQIQLHSFLLGNSSCRFPDNFLFPERERESRGPNTHTVFQFKDISDNENSVLWLSLKQTSYTYVIFLWHL